MCEIHGSYLITIFYILFGILIMCNNECYLPGGLLFGEQNVSGRNIIVESKLVLNEKTDRLELTA